MSATIRMQVVRLLRDAIDELDAHPNAHTAKELAGLATLAEHYDRPEFAARLARLAFDTWIGASEPGR